VNIDARSTPFRRPAYPVRQLYLQLQLQADAVSGIGRAAVLVPHGQPEDRRAEHAGISCRQPLGRGAVVTASRPRDYLARVTGHFEGNTEQERWQAREWLSWEADHITAVARVRHSARFRKMHDEVIAEFRPRAEEALSFVNDTVKDRLFLLGDRCTIADIGCWGRMVFMAEGGFEIGDWPHLQAWAGRLKALPGFALPYDLIPSKDREYEAAPHSADI
jgi:hypothetical protein